MVWNGIERRKRVRVVLLCKVKVIYSSRVFFAHTKDIAEGGVKIVLKEKLEPHSDVELEIKIGIKKTVKCKGEVRWVSEIAESTEKARLFEAGIRFSQISDSDRQYIKMVVDETLDLEKRVK